MPRLYIVAREGGPWKRNAYVEEDGDGMLQEVQIFDEGGRIRLGGYKGVVVPLSYARPYIIRIQKGGLDEYVRKS
jgi:hypothetical protein